MCGVTNYDENVLQQYADDLYKQAKWIVVMSALRYGLVVFLASFGTIMVVASSQKNVSTDAANSGMMLVLFLTLIGIAVGVDAGRRKAFMLKLQAQQILCQRQTEINTRKYRAAFKRYESSCESEQHRLMLWNNQKSNSVKFAGKTELLREPTGISQRSLSAITT